MKRLIGPIVVVASILALGACARPADGAASVPSMSATQRVTSAGPSATTRGTTTRPSPAATTTTTRPSPRATTTTRRTTPSRPTNPDLLPTRKPKDAGASWFDESSADPEARGFVASDLPTFRCDDPKLDGDDTSDQAEGQRFLDCLRRGWQPLLTSLDTPLPRIRLKLFETTDSEGICPKDVHGCATESGVIYLRKNYVGDPFPGARPVPQMDLLMHEFSHQIQFVVLGRMDSGITDPSAARIDRRLETQAEVLALMMLQRNLVTPLAIDVMREFGLVDGGDEFHWGLTSMRYWAQRSSEGRSLALADTWRAADKLLAWDPAR